MPFPQSLTTHLTPLTTHFRSNPVLFTSAALAATLSLLPAVSYAVTSYRGWLALGPGGPPYNIVGWLAQGVLHLFALPDRTNPRHFSRPAAIKPYPAHAHDSFLVTGDEDGGADSALPQRTEPRPSIPDYVAPQRQVTQQAGPETRARMNAFLWSLVAANPSTLAQRPSALEGKHHDAVWLATPAVAVPRFMKGTKGEAVHVHPEGSTHVTLSLRDAEDAVRKGWAERQMLSGSTLSPLPLPVTYVLIYAPRDDGEFEVWKRIVTAGLRFMTFGVGDLKLE